MAGNVGKVAKLGVFTLAIMNVTAVVSLRGLPAEAEYGLSSAFYYLFAALAQFHNTIKGYIFVAVNDANGHHDCFRLYYIHNTSLKKEIYESS